MRLGCFGLVTEFGLFVYRRRVCFLCPQLDCWRGSLPPPGPSRVHAPHMVVDAGCTPRQRGAPSRTGALTSVPRTMPPSMRWPWPWDGAHWTMLIHNSKCLRTRYVLLSIIYLLLLSLVVLSPPLKRTYNYALRADKNSLCLVKFLVNTIHIYDFKLIY
jgi:hypothetical protein